MNINRPELIRQLSSKYGYNIDSATQIVDGFCKVILDNLEAGNSVSIYGFGVFDCLERKGRTWTNPATDETYTLATHWVPRFYPGTRMRVAVKKWEDNEKRGLN